MRPVLSLSVVYPRGPDQSNRHPAGPKLLYISGRIEGLLGAVPPKMEIQSAKRPSRGVRRLFPDMAVRAFLFAALLPLLTVSPRSATLESLPGLPFTPSAQPIGRL